VVEPRSSIDASVTRIRGEVLTAVVPACAQKKGLSEHRANVINGQVGAGTDVLGRGAESPGACPATTPHGTRPDP
jgi:hypothetical protein